ncbi:MAG: methyltransferase, partial [Myxococcota bacterium]|nr:methyltransferase [Myxococcota bacterium]
MSTKHAEGRSQQLSQLKRDEPYRAGCSIYTHPSQIAAIAALHHVNTPAFDRPRVLELGTAAGENL